MPMKQSLHQNLDKEIDAAIVLHEQISESWYHQDVYELFERMESALTQNTKLILHELLTDEAEFEAKYYHKKQDYDNYKDSLSYLASIDEFRTKRLERSLEE